MQLTSEQKNVDIVNNNFKNSLSQIPEQLREWAREFEVLIQLEEIHIMPDKGSKKSYAIVWSQWRDTKLHASFIRVMKKDISVIQFFRFRWRVCHIRYELPPPER